MKPCKSNWISVINARDKYQLSLNRLYVMRNMNGKHSTDLYYNKETGMINAGFLECRKQYRAEMYAYAQRLYYAIEQFYKNDTQLAKSLGTFYHVSHNNWRDWVVKRLWTDAFAESYGAIRLPPRLRKWIHFAEEEVKRREQ